MNFLESPTKAEELKTFKTFLKNRGEKFDDALIELENSEPTDFGYNNINYQITRGDKDFLEKTKKSMAKFGKYCYMRNVSDIVHSILCDTLKKKALRSDKNTILLIEVASSSRGNLSWAEFEKKTAQWALSNPHLCKCWKEIYLIFGVGVSVSSVSNNCRNIRMS